MNLLLDTQAWLWFVLGDPRLSANAQSHIQNPANVKLLSPASFWEIAIKISLNKYALTVPYSHFVTNSVIGNGLSVLQISPQHAEQVSVLPFPANHRDPFDRLLVSQALIEGIAIVSSDPALDQYGIQRIW